MNDNNENVKRTARRQSHRHLRSSSAFRLIGEINDSMVAEARDESVQNEIKSENKGRRLSLQFIPIAAAAVVLAVGTAVMHSVFAPAPDDPILVPFPTETSSFNYSYVTGRDFDFPNISEEEIENMSSEVMLAIALGKDTDFDFPEHYWYDDFGVPVKEYKKGMKYLSGEYEEYIAWWSAESREEAESLILRDIYKWDNENCWTKDLSLEYIGENDFYYSFRLKYTTEFSAEYIEVQRESAKSFGRDENFDDRTELHSLNRAFVFKSDVYNSGGFRSQTCNFEPKCICGECIEGYSYFPQESLDSYETILHVLDLQTFNLTLFDRSGDGRIVYRYLEETDDKFIYTYYRVAESSDFHGYKNGGAFMEKTRRIIHKSDGKYDLLWDEEHYQYEQVKRVTNSGGLSQMPFTLDEVYADPDFGKYFPQSGSMKNGRITGLKFRNATRHEDLYNNYLDSVWDFYGGEENGGSVSWRVSTPRDDQIRTYEISLERVKDAAKVEGYGYTHINLYFFVDENIVIEIDSDGVTAEEMWRIIDGQLTVDN